MLCQLSIKNIALIDELTVDFEYGMNCLTGETGAGKSVIIDSVNVILGERAAKDLIRSGENTASVEAVFNVESIEVSKKLSEIGIEEEQDYTLIIYREFSVSGKNNCRINGRPVTVSMLKILGEVLVDIHGQYDNQSLMKVETHINLLDKFGGKPIEDKINEYCRHFDRYKSIKKQIMEITGDPQERERLKDLLEYQADEIDKAKLKTNEDREISERRELLVNSEKIAKSLNEVYEMLYSSADGQKTAFDLVSLCRNSLNQITKYGDNYNELLSKDEELFYGIEDLGELIRKETENLEFDPNELEKIDERLDLIYRLKKKYGNTIEEVLDFYQSACEKLDKIANSGELAKKLGKDLASERERLDKSAAELTLLRKEAAARLEEGITKHLDELEMKQAVFKVYFEKIDTDYREDGLDKIQFLISANPGEPVKALSKIASGGELSRIMLAIKTMFAEVDDIPVLIFDEIDIGISGRAARKVGEKMRFISKNHQVICVTHLAQIAAISNCNICIEKTYEEGRTLTRANILDKTGKIQEIARLLDGGNVTETTIKHAAEMIESST
ncbi:MAG: DNA repair protein RecN [Clostridiales bacterium]|jgi:DNA repair protein RecN (Recombination protein N)|nr:DNA repair protein RecN [Clostridiales bacterium]